MHTIPRANAELDKLNEERDHINIQISLLKDGPHPDRSRMLRLQRTAEDLEQRIAKYRPSDATGIE